MEVTDEDYDSSLEMLMEDYHDVSESETDNEDSEHKELENIRNESS